MAYSPSPYGLLSVSGYGMSPPHGPPFGIGVQPLWATEVLQEVKDIKRVKSHLKNKKDSKCHVSQDLRLRKKVMTSINALPTLKTLRHSSSQYTKSTTRFLFSKATSKINKRLVFLFRKSVKIIE